MLEGRQWGWCCRCRGPEKTLCFIDVERNIKGTWESISHNHGNNLWKVVNKIVLLKWHLMRPSSFLTLLISIASLRISKMLTTWSWQTQTSPTPGNMEQAIFRGSATNYLGNIWGYNLSTWGESQLKRWQDIEQTTEVVVGLLSNMTLGKHDLSVFPPNDFLTQ